MQDKEIYKVSVLNKLLTLTICLFLSGLYIYSGRNGIFHIFSIIFCSLVVLCINLPLYLVEIELKDHWIIINWRIHSIKFSCYEVLFIGKSWIYQQGFQRKIFPYSFVCLNEGKETLYSFPKVKNMKQMMIRCKQINNAISID